MAADLHIHIVEEKDFEFFNNAFADESLEKSNILIGEASWLKAALTGDNKTYIPSTIQRVHDIIGECYPVIDDELIKKIEEAFCVDNATCYELHKWENVRNFLVKHKGKRCQTISWW